MSEISRIIGSVDSRKQKITLSIFKYDDYAYIYILLVLLRMSYLLLKLKNERSWDFAVKIDSTIIKIANSSLNEYSITDNVTMVKTLQCGLYLKLYKRRAPEFTEGMREERSGLSYKWLTHWVHKEFWATRNHLEKKAMAYPSHI